MTITELKILSTRITDNDIKVIKLLASGLIFSEISKQTGWSKRTLENNIARLREQLDCKNTTSLVAFFLRNKLID